MEERKQEKVEIGNDEGKDRQIRRTERRKTLIKER